MHASRRMINWKICESRARLYVVGIKLNKIKIRLHSEGSSNGSRTRGRLKRLTCRDRKKRAVCVFRVVRSGRGKVYRPANPVGTVPLLLSLFDRTSIRLSSNFRVRGWANISGTAEPRLRLGSDGEAADRREDKFVPQLRRACRSKSCLLGISSSPSQV